MSDGLTVVDAKMMRAVTAFPGMVIGWTIRAYQLLVAPLLPGCCRYYPSCSEYARQAITGHGVVAGGWLALKRILRCHPWGGSGVDPVPAAENKPAHAHRCHVGGQG